ncbi:MAG TPA: OmpP1/FadL family transporter [Woeseiaceae bacterium]|nr:OmpP1/FadL family transporter [Woeseiaceae bacterium]
MRPRMLTFPVVAATFTVLLTPTLATAASFQIQEQSASRLGTAFAGTASIADDATTVFYNPAGMSQLEGGWLIAGASAIRPVADFNNQGSINALGAPLTGSAGEIDDSHFVPHVYYVQPLTDEWTFGLGFNAPFGLASDWDNDWIGRYHATESDLAVININPTFAYEVTDRFAVGFGINYQRIDATLENAVDSFAACTGATGNAAGCIGGAFGAPLAPAGLSQDSHATIEGDDSGFGIDLSLFWQLSDRSNLGVLWRQGIDFTLEGSADFDLSSACAANAGCSGALAALEGGIEAEVQLPDTVTVSLSHRLDDQWALHGDIAWTRWSSIQEVAIVNTGNGATVSTLELNYDDTMRYALGVTYEPGTPWTWRAGIAFDEAPQTDPDFVTPRIPDADRQWVAVGLSYAFSDNYSVDAAYAHLWVEDTAVNRLEQGNTLIGGFESSVDILALSATWRF